jgi:uncharacterized protein (TIGR02118 family)
LLPLKHESKVNTVIAVSILYSNEPGCTFDFDYYRDRHMPMIKEKMAGACSHFKILKGVAGGTPGQPATYVAMGHLFFQSVDAFLAAFSPHAREIAADIPRYTNVTPVVQISEVLADQL